MLTTEQLTSRKLGLGSSDVAAIFGLDPFRSAYDLWLDKTGKVDDFAGNAATDRGNVLEPAILNWAERELGAALVRNVTVKDPAGGVLAATLDADCPQLNAVVEAKSTVDARELGEPYTDQVPDRFAVQTTVAMTCAARELAYIPVLLPEYKRFDFRMYINPLDKDLADAIRERASQWWQKYIVGDVPPNDSVPHIEVLKRMRRVPSKIVDVGEELVIQWRNTRQARLDAETIEAAAEVALLAAIGDAEAGNSDAGLVTYMQTTQNRKAQPAKTITFRTLREKKAKS